jgi:hypothetical protein
MNVMLLEFLNENDLLDQLKDGIGQLQEKRIELNILDIDLQ